MKRRRAPRHADGVVASQRRAGVDVEANGGVGEARILADGNGDQMQWVVRRSGELFAKPKVRVDDSQRSLRRSGDGGGGGRSGGGRREGGRRKDVLHGMGGA